MSKETKRGASLRHSKFLVRHSIFNSSSVHRIESKQVTGPHREKGMSDYPDHVTVRVKRLDGNQDIALPSYETEGASGLDLRAAVNGELTLHPGEIKLVPTGLAISLPRGYEAQIRPRSGLALKHGVGMV